jgi:type I restriction enzyme S subunit
VLIPGFADVKQAALAKAALAKFTEDPTPENLQLLFHPSFTIGPDDLKKIVLDLAVRGKLERQDPKDEPAEELLARVRKDSHGQKHGEKLALINADRDELPHSIPSNWAWSCVQEIAQPNESVTYGILKPVWVENGVPTVRVTEMKSGVIDVSQLLMCETERASKFSKTTLKEGDLLISKDGTIGKTAFVPRDLVGGNITQHMLRFAISTKLDRFFVRICIDAPPCQAWMIGETKGVALQGVNVGDFRRMPIPIPPLPEQRRIVAKVQHLIALTERLSSQLEASRTTGEKLLEAMVAELTAP